MCQVVFIALKARFSSEWYFDSGCLRHMTRDKSFLTSLDYNGGTVIFGDGSITCVKAKESISIPGYHKLYEVLYVDGLKANLLSISQIFDNEDRVIFCQDLCEVVNKEGKIIITRQRIVDNCYIINPNSRTLLVYSKSKLDLTELCHRRLSHINYKDLMHLVNSKKVRGILKLSGEPKPICGECMKGKQTKSSHKRINEIRTIIPLDLLYMDLMGPTCTGSRDGKRYVLVVVDDKILLYEFS